jgi:hypothetical protein
LRQARRRGICQHDEQCNESRHGQLNSVQGPAPGCAARRPAETSARLQRPIPHFPLKDSRQLDFGLMRSLAPRHATMFGGKSFSRQSRIAANRSDRRNHVRSAAERVFPSFPFEAGLLPHG